MKTKDIVTKILIGLMFLLCLSAIAFIFGYVVIKGIGEISIEFITGVPEGIPQGTEGEIFPAIAGSLLAMIIAMAISSALAVSTAVFNVFFNRWKRLKDFIVFVNRILAGLPSIIFALFGYGVFIVMFGINRSLITASMTLAVMIYPFIEINTEKILCDIDSQFIQDSRGLGVSDGYMVMRMILPEAARSIGSTVILGGSYAVGATAPVILTGAVLFAKVPKSLTDPVMMLPFHLHMLLSQGISVEKAYGTAFVLIILLIIINSAAFLMSRDWRKKNAENK